MRQQTQETNRPQTGNLNHEPVLMPMTDLELDGAQANEVKAGGICHGVTILAWAGVNDTRSNAAALLNVSGNDAY